MSCICNVGVRSLGKSESATKNFQNLHFWNGSDKKLLCLPYIFCLVAFCWSNKITSSCHLTHIFIFCITFVTDGKKLCGSRWWLQHAQLLTTTQLNVGLHLEAAWSFRVLTSSGLYTFIDGWLTFDLISRSHVKKMLTWSYPSTVSFDTVEFKLVWYV